MSDEPATKATSQQATQLFSQRERTSVAWIMCISVAGICFIVAGVFALAFRPHRGPILHLNTEIVRLATRSNAAHAKVELTNRGDEPLNITRVTSTCGCLNAELKDRELRPGAKTFLDVRLQAPPVGEKSSAVILETNDPSNAVRRVLFSVTRENDVPYVADAFEPLLITSVLGAASEETARTIRFRTYERAETSPWVRSVACSLQSLRIELALEKTEPTHDRECVRRQYVLLLVPTEVGGGSSTGSLSLFDNDDNSGEPLGSWQVTHQVTGSISVVPRVVQLSAEDPSAKPSARVFVRSVRPEAAWNIVALRTSAPWLQALETPSESTAARVVRITIDPTMRGEESEGELVICTDQTGCEAINVRVLVTPP